MAPRNRLTSNGSGVNCDVCRNLDYHSSLPDGDGDMRVGRSLEKSIVFGRCFSKFENSADQGCPVCWVLASICRLSDDAIDTGTDSQLVIDLDADGDGYLSCPGYMYLHLYVPKDNTPRDKSSLFQSLQVQYDISESPWSETAQKFARDSIQACIKNHDLCGLGESLLPRRVIEVGNVGDDYLRLYETQRRTPGLYIALSYCWGSDQQLKTTSANIEDMTCGRLRLSHLPQTLADAVYVTRSLGIHYLWVDALCIIQDSVEDWETESEQMASIYEKAYLVIAASSAPSVKEGFLNHQRQKHQLHFDIQSTDGTQSCIAARQHPESGFHDRSLSMKYIDPLAQRAWAFQEQHMSTRCLIFSVDELQWVCKTMVDCECGRIYGSLHGLQLLSANCDKIQQGGEASSQLELHRMWQAAVEKYSFRKLTQPDDKLPALSGLASKFGASMGFRYVAGLWEQTILQDLMWTRYQGLASLPIKSRAPSFSWASIDCGVEYCYATTEPWRWVSCSFVCDLAATVPGHNPFGKVGDAWLTIQGPMVRGTIKGCKYPNFCSDDGGIDFALRADCPLTSFSYATAGNGDEISMRRCRYPSTPGFEASRGEAREDNDRSSSAVESWQVSNKMDSNFALASVWLLHLGRSNDATSSRFEDAGGSTDCYLVLGKSPRDPQKYERIGCCTPRSEETLEKHSERFIVKTITIV